MSIATRFPITYAERAELGEALVRFNASWDDYIDLRAAAEYRLEYDDNQIITMSYASDPHETIVINIGALLNQIFFDADEISVKGSNRPIYIPQFKSEFNPDVQVVKGKPQFKALRKGVNANLNPWLVVEVLSKSTRNRDWAEKFPKYKKISSLQHILYVEQDYPFVSVFHRQGNTAVWENIDYDNLEQSLMLENQEIKLAHIYRKILFT